MRDSSKRFYDFQSLCLDIAGGNKRPREFCDKNECDTNEHEHCGKSEDIAQITVKYEDGLNKEPAIYISGLGETDAYGRLLAVAIKKTCEDLGIGSEGRGRIASVVGLAVAQESMLAFRGLRK